MRPDTIVAVSTPAGRSARAIVRLSGPDAVEIAAALFTAAGGGPLAELPAFRCAEGGALAERLPCRLYLMRAPKSYTREDVVELHLPGSPLVAELALEAAIRGGARLAGPGEFTRRAVENGRISPDQAEAVIGLIRARSRAELAAAASQLAGHAGTELAAWRERAEDLAAFMEAELDYGEEPGEFLGDGEAGRRLEGLAAELEELARRGAERAEAETDPAAPRAALAGPVNAGKSLLFNALTRREALVSDQRGTTRDVLEAPLAAAPGDVALLDTAGLGAPAGEVELLARAAAERVWRGAEVLVLVIDRSEGLDPDSIAPALRAAREAEVPVVLVFNKSDLPAAVSLEDAARALGGVRPAAALEVSALTGAGCAELAMRLAGLVREGKVERSPARAAAGARRREVLASALGCLRRAGDAPDLSCAGDDLGAAARLVALHFEPGAGRAELDESVLNRIFARFCVGK